MDEETKNFFKSKIKVSDRDVHKKVLMFSDIIPPEEEQKIKQEILTSIPDQNKYTDYLPVYSLQAACGNFGEGVSADEIGWIKVNGLKLNKNMFISQVFGKSMEPDIPSGSYCVFRTPVVGSRMNKIVLVQHNSIADVDNGGRYTVKRYTSKKKMNRDETWEHEEIALLPINPEYKPIVISNPEDGNFMVIAEFVKVI
jgi:SOS-response transcriptional repressor LexA